MKFSILGAGCVERSLSAVAVRRGRRALLSNSQGPPTLPSEVAIIGCQAGAIEEAAAFGDVVVVAIPLKHCSAVPVEPLAGQVVIDATNDDPGRDFAIPEPAAGTTTSSERLAAHLPRSKVATTPEQVIQP